MYKVSFSPKAAAQYADIVEILSNYPKKLLTFENEIESLIRRLEKMPESYSIKGSLRAARLRKSQYYMFYKVENEDNKVLVILLISQQADPQNWPV